MASVQYPLIKDLAPGAVTNAEVAAAAAIAYSKLNLATSILGSDIDKIGDNVNLWLDTAKTFGFKYSTDLGGVLFPSLIGTVAECGIYANVAADGSGLWDPWLELKADGTAELGAEGGTKIVFIRPGDYAKIGSVANYVKVTNAGQLSLVGTGRVKNHFRIDPERLTLPASNFPAAGRKGMFPTLDFDKTTEESAYLSDYVPFRKDAASDIDVAITWCCDAATSGAVVWGIEYRSIETGEAVDGATTTITQANTTNATAGNMNTCVFTTNILAANIASNDDIGIRVYRKAADGADTLDEDARLIGIHLHFITDKLGQAL